MKNLYKKINVEQHCWRRGVPEVPVVVHAMGGKVHNKGASHILDVVGDKLND